jgi:hypothetical protein
MNFTFFNINARILQRKENKAVSVVNSYVYYLYYVCIAVLTLDAELLARSQYPEGLATGHLDTGFS